MLEVFVGPQGDFFLQISGVSNQQNLVSLCYLNIISHDHFFIFESFISPAQKTIADGFLDCSSSV